MVGAAELHPVVGADEVGQLHEHVVLVAPEIDRGDGSPEGGRACDAVPTVDGRGELRLQVADQVAELLDSVLHRGAGQEEHPVDASRPRSDRPAPSCRGVLDEMSLVHDELVDRHLGGHGERVQRVERRHADAALALPHPLVRRALQSMQPVRAQIASVADFPSPVDEDAGRAGHEESLRARRPEMCHGGDCLDRLPQPHLVSDDDASAREREARPESLVPAQRHPPVCVLERM